MKYSNNLPKISYSTTLGDFNVVDLSSYFTIDNKNLDTTTITTSKATTLVELAGSIYSDTDRFWLFLLANEKINPFTLTKQDDTVLQDEYASNLSINITNISNDVIIPAGSIIYPAISNSGNSYSFGFTGEFSLTGGFGLVQSFNPFTKIATVLDPYSGATFTENNYTSILINGDTGYYYYSDPSGLTANRINYVQSQKNEIAYIKFKDGSGAAITDTLLDGVPIVEKGGSSFIPSGSSAAYSYSVASSIENREINYYLPYSVGYLNLTKVIQNYSV